jgi:serine/threonine protein kinase
MDDSVVCGRFVSRLDELYEFNKKDVLGKGKYGTVYRGRTKVSGKECAIKVIKKIKMDRSDVRREVRIIQKIMDNPHENIVCLMDWFETRREYVIVTELLHGGELFYFLEDRGFLSEADAVHYIRQLLLALKHLHSHDICHLDLKPENIVLVDNECSEIKLVDFGAAKDLNEEEKGAAFALVGTPEFVAPEVIAFNPITGAADMWALGVITYVMLSGLSPFLGDNDMETLASVTRADFYFPDDDFPPVSDDAKEFICSLLVKNPRKRLTAEQALEHKWLKPDNKRISTILIPTDNLKSFNGRQKIMATFHVVRFAIKMRVLYQKHKLKHVEVKSSDTSKTLATSTIKAQQQQQEEKLEQENKEIGQAEMIDLLTSNTENNPANCIGTSPSRDIEVKTLSSLHGNSAGISEGDFPAAPHLYDGQLMVMDSAVRCPLNTVQGKADQTDHTSDVQGKQTSDVQIEQTSDVQGEQTSDVQVEQTSDIQIEQTSDVQVEQTSDIQIEQTSDVQVDQTSDNHNSNVQIDQTSDAQVDQSSDVQVDQMAVIQVDQTSDVQVDQPSEVPVDQTSDVQVDQPSEVPVDQTSGTPVDLISDIQVDQTSDVQVDHTSDVQVDQTSGTPVDLISDIQVDQTSDVQVDHTTPVDLISDIQVDQTSDIQVDHTSDIQVDQTLDVQVDHTTDIQVDQTSGTQVNLTSDAQVDQQSNDKAVCQVHPNRDSMLDQQAETELNHSQDVMCTEHDTQIDASQTDFRQGSEIDVEQDTQADAQPDSQTDAVDLISDIQVDQMEQGTQTDVNPDSQTDVEQDTQTDIQPDSQTDVEQGTQTDVNPDSQTDVEQDTQTDIQPDSQTDVEQGTQTYIQPDSQKAGEQGRETDIRLDTQTDVNLDIQTDVEQEAQLDVQLDIQTVAKPDVHIDMDPITKTVKQHKQNDVEPDGQIAFEQNRSRGIALNGHSQSEQVHYGDVKDSEVKKTEQKKEDGTNVCKRTAEEKVHDTPFDLQSPSSASQGCELTIDNARGLPQLVNTSPDECGQCHLNSTKQDMAVVDTKQSNGENMADSKRILNVEDGNCDAVLGSLVENSTHEADLCPSPSHIQPKAKVEGLLLVMQGEERETNEKRLSQQAWDSSEDAASPTEGLYDRPACTCIVQDSTSNEMVGDFTSSGAFSLLSNSCTVDLGTE